MIVHIKPDELSIALPNLHTYLLCMLIIVIALRFCIFNNVHANLQQTLELCKCYCTEHRLQLYNYTTNKYKQI